MDSDLDSKVIETLERQTEQLWAFQDVSLKPLWAWVAGIIDGEGAITIFLNRNRNPRGRHQLMLRVQMADKKTIERIKEITNVGSLSVVRPRQQWHRVQYNWACGSKQSRAVLRLCLPWLVTKRQKALLALAFQDIVSLSDGRGHVDRSQAAFSKRDAIAAALTILNRRGEHYNASQG